jgi:hypothetical protein
VCDKTILRCRFMDSALPQRPVTRFFLVLIVDVLRAAFQDLDFARRIKCGDDRLEQGRDFRGSKPQSKRYYEGDL